MMDTKREEAGSIEGGKQVAARLYTHEEIITGKWNGMESLKTGAFFMVHSMGIYIIVRLIVSE